ncbi:MAG TPA: S24 family peptidase [Candidatus Paceibacterota bacterium]|nr:S24 family peptidase [Candidatus Paceibacterota bacterium]
MAGNFRTHDEDGAFDTMTLDEYLVENREATFMMRARGEGLSDRGILDGDLLLVDRSREPRPSDIVVVVENGSFSMKPASSIAASLDGETRVEAVVTAVIRKY